MKISIWYGLLCCRTLFYYSLQGFIQDLFLGGGGGGDVDVCKGCMHASVRRLGFCRF